MGVIMVWPKFQPDIFAIDETHKFEFKTRYAIDVLPIPYVIQPYTETPDMQQKKSAGEITHLLFTDVETTGHNPNGRHDQIVELSAALVRLEDRVIVDFVEYLIKPHGPQSVVCDPGRPNGAREWLLGPYHTQNGHFQGVDFWADGVDLYDALTSFATLAEGATFAGQNPRFDLEHLQRDFHSCAIPWPETDYHLIDIASPAMFLVMAKQVDGISLRKTGPWAKCGPQTHRAGQDVRDAIQAFWAMHDFFILGKTPGVQFHPGDTVQDKNEPVDTEDPEITQDRDPQQPWG